MRITERKMIRPKCCLLRDFVRCVCTGMLNCRNIAPAAVLNDEVKSFERY